jgi:predicted outer membrane repeat protein
MSNAAGDGGGLYSQVGATVLESTFAGNLATDAGGGIKVTGGTLTLDRSTLSGNTVLSSTWGGGGLLAGGLGVLVVITNTTFSGNQAARDGGGLYLQSGTANLNNVTLTGNTADADGDDGGAGGGLWVNPAGATLNLRNTLLAANADLSPATRHPDCAGPLASQGYNLVGDDAGCALTPVLGDQVGTAAAPIDPRLGPLAGNGGPTHTHGLLAGSPALESANPASCAPVDQRGLARPDGALCDIGAFEGVVPLVRLLLALLVR